MTLGGLRLFGILDRYVGGLFVAAYATAFLLVIGLAEILFFASNLDYFEPWPDGRTVPALEVLRFYLLNVPFLYLQVAPFVTMIAGLFTVSRMVRNNETVAVMAAGVSAQRLILPVLGGGVLAALAMFAVREWSANAVAPQRDALLDMFENQRTGRVFENVWFKDSSGDVVHIKRFQLTDTWRLVGLVVVSKRHNVHYQDQADRGVWTETPSGPRWVLENGVRREVDAASSPTQALQDLEFTPQDILVAIKGQERPLELSFSEIDALARRDPDSSEYQTLLQYNLTFPLANVVLLLVALPLMLGRERGRHLEGLVAGCLLCVVYFAADFVSRALGMEGTLSPLLASWLPVLVFGSLGVVLLESART